MPRVWSFSSSLPQPFCVASIWHFFAWQLWHLLCYMCHICYRFQRWSVVITRTKTVIDHPWHPFKSKNRGAGCHTLVVRLQVLGAGLPSKSLLLEFSDLIAYLTVFTSSHTLKMKTYIFVALFASILLAGYGDAVS